MLAQQTEVQETKEERMDRLKKQFIEQSNDYIVLKSKEDLEALEPTKLNTWIFDGNGIHLTIKNAIGEFTGCVNKTELHGLPKLMSPCFRINVPKIPATIYKQVQQFFYDIADRMDDAEAYVQIYFDKEEDKYFVNVPMQKVAGASVHYDAENLSNANPDRYIFVCEIHSHNTMSAFFSGVDDADEKECRFYGVFGKIKDEEPEFVLRFVTHEAKPTVKPSDVFNFKEEVQYPSEWHNNVKKMSQSTGLSHLDEDKQQRKIVRGPQGEQELANPDTYDFNEDEYWDPRFGHWGRYPFSGTPSGSNTISPIKRIHSGLPEHVKKKAAEVKKELPLEEQSEVEELRAELTSRDSNLPGPGDDDEESGISLEQMEQSNEELRGFVEDVELYEAVEERYQIIRDFVDAINPLDVENLVEALIESGYYDQIRKQIRKSA